MREEENNLHDIYRENGLKMAPNGISPQNRFFKPPTEKLALIFAFSRHFWGPYGSNYVAKSTSIQRPLIATLRGANQPYFGKWGYNRAYSPQETKRCVLRGFPV